MKAYEFLVEYNLEKILDTFAENLLAKWKSEGKPHADEIGKGSDSVVAANLIKWLEQFDPTQNNKYITWILQKYAGKKGGIKRLEDIPGKTAEALDQYERLRRKKKLKPEHKDINQIKSLTELQDAMDEYKDEETSSRSEIEDSVEKAFYDSGEAELVYNDNEYKVVIPNTEKSSCYFGRNTRWCTAATGSYNYFDSYHQKGNMYIILHKPTNSRWQWQFEVASYMTEKDEPIKNLNQFLKKHEKVVGKVLDHFGGIDKAAQVSPAVWFKFLNNPSKEATIAAVKVDPDMIQHLKNPSEQIQLAAIWAGGRRKTIIKYIENPSERVQLRALQLSPASFRFINNPTEKTLFAVIDLWPKAIKNMKKPTEELQQAAVSKKPDVIEFIENPSEEVQLISAKGKPSSIKFIKNPSEAVQLIAVKNNPFAISHLTKMRTSDKVQIAAVKGNGKVIKHISNPSDAVQLAAVGENIESIVHITKQAESAQLFVVKKSSQAHKLIKRPTRRVEALFRELYMDDV